MKILFVTHYSGMYGANQSLCQLILELRKKYNVKPIVLLPSTGEICEFLEQNDIKYFVSHYYWWVNAEKGIYQYLLNWRKQLINLLRVRSLVSLVKNEKIDLVYSNSVTINIGAFLSRRLKCSHIWHFRESLNSFHFKLSLGSFISMLFLRTAANKYILISDYLINSYAKLLPFDKIERIYNGIDFSRINAVREKKDEIINICMMGIISDQKNNFDALKAICILVKKYKITNIRLHFIGGHKAEYLQLLKKYIAENELEDYVIFHGHIKDVDSLLSIMHLGLMCSRNEAFGRVTVEYMLHKMPVIASDSGANSELIKDGFNGFIYKLYNFEQLAKHILYFTQNTSLINEFGSRGREFAIDNFSSEKNTEMIYYVIKNLQKD